MAGRKIVMACFTLGLALESAFFARQCVAGLFRLLGEGAFYQNDHPAAWRYYQLGLHWGGERDQMETDKVELLLFGLDQTEAGLRLKTALPAEEAVRVAHNLAARLIRGAPYRTHYWSLAADIYSYEARQRRRTIPIDISRLPSDPLEALLTEDWLGIAALKRASALEPNNSTYHDLLVDTFLAAGSPESAAEPCRRAIATFPRLDAHGYLLEPTLAPALLEQALLGFADALAGDSMEPRASIERDTGRLLAAHDQHQRALPHLQRAVELSPEDYNAIMDLALSHLALKDCSSAMASMKVASELRPEDPWPHNLTGRCLLEAGNATEAVQEFRRARERSEGSPGEVTFFEQLGEALEKVGQTVEAERQFVAAANLHPSDKEALHGLLSFYMRQGNFGDAVEICPKLLAVSPGESRYEQECASARQGKK